MDLHTLISEGFLSNLWSEIIIAIIMAILTWVVAQLTAFVGSKHTGKWVDEIYDSSGINIIKRDEYTLRHNKFSNKIRGSITRIEPNDQRHRQWICTGVIDGDYLILTFWSYKKLLKSNGCIYARHTGDNIFDGYYLEDHNGVIDQTKIRLIKCCRDSL